jgi:hypothetical protein
MRPRWRVAAALALAPLGVGVGCSGELTGIGGATNSASFGDGSRSVTRAGLDAALVGRWRRAVAVAAGYATAGSSETTWTFAADGSALRSVVTRDPALGLVDSYTVAASWRADGRTVLIALRSPELGPARFTYAVVRTTSGDVLYLDGQGFQRVGF